MTTLKAVTFLPFVVMCAIGATNIFGNEDE